MPDLKEKSSAPIKRFSVAKPVDAPLIMLEKRQEGEIEEGEVVRVVVNECEECFGAVVNGKPFEYPVRMQKRPFNKLPLRNDERFHDLEGDYDRAFALERQRAEKAAKHTVENGWRPKQNPQKKFLCECIYCGAYTESAGVALQPCSCRS